MGKEKIMADIFLISILLFNFLPSICKSNISVSENPPPYFNISILVPESNERCVSWANILMEQLQKIGIGIDVFDTANWSEIFQRSFDFPGPYPIPTYSNGGYDILIYDATSDLDYSPFGLYDSPSITPHGDNILQYENHSMDLAVLNYTFSYNQIDRLNWAKEIQALLYNDVPSIAATYLQTLLIHDTNLNGWNPLLWYKAYQNMANWSIPQETTFNYAQSEPTENFHMYYSTRRADLQWLNQIYNGLIERKANLNGFYGSNIATDWSTTDGLSYIVNLNPNVTWADGIPLNASDIEYSYELRGNLSTTYTLTDIHYILMNVTIIDEYSLEFNFPEKNVFQENLLALPILPKHIWQNIPYENHKEQAELWATTDPTKLIGAGPYYLFNYNNDTKIVHLKRNDYYKNYTEINPHFENIYFKYYSNKESTLNDITSGKIDFIDPLFAFNFNDVPINASYSISHTGKVQLIAINNKNPWIGTGELCPISDPLSAQKIRTAISYSIPKQLIIDEVYNGLGSYGVTPWSNIALDFDNQLEPIEFDLDYAKYLLKYSGFDYGCEPAPCTTTSIIGLSFRILFVTSLISILAIRYLIKRKR